MKKVKKSCIIMIMVNGWLLLSGPGSWVLGPRRTLECRTADAASASIPSSILDLDLDLVLGRGLGLGLGSFSLS